VNKASGLLLVIGSLVFLVAAFMPISSVYAERDVQAQIARVEGERVAWVVSHIVFALGGALAAVGLSLLTFSLARTSASIPALVGLAAIVVSTLCWVGIEYLRITLLPAIVFQDQTLGWPFVVYTLSMQAALIAYGYGLLQTDYPRWMGLVGVIAGAMLFGTYVIFKDVPPFAYYLILLAIGIGTLVQRSSQPQ